MRQTDKCHLQRNILTSQDVNKSVKTVHFCGIKKLAVSKICLEYALLKLSSQLYCYKFCLTLRIKRYIAVVGKLLFWLETNKLGHF